MAADINTVQDAMLAMRGINWELSNEESIAIENAVRTAAARIQDIAGVDSLDFGDSDVLDIVCNAAWYIREQRWPEFVSGYAGELILLRAKGAFSCG